MTPEEFLEWIDEEMEKAERMSDRENRKYEPDQSYCGRLRAFEEMKEKYLSILLSPTIN